MCPNIHLLKTYKVFPRKLNFNYVTDAFFIYIYLNPFVEFQTPKSYKIGNREFCFAYEPIYVGKGTGAGYRHNQHLSTFIRGNENNSFKVQVFSELQNNLADAASKQERDKPWNFDEYQKQYVVILETFQDPRALLDFEMKLINNIGTLKDQKGPLANKIVNAYKFGNLSGGRQIEL